jgi:hypothetical protein
VFSGCRVLSEEEKNKKNLRKEKKNFVLITKSNLSTESFFFNLTTKWIFFWEDRIQNSVERLTEIIQTQNAWSHPLLKEIINNHRKYNSVYYTSSVITYFSFLHRKKTN